MMKKVILLWITLLVTSCAMVKQKAKQNKYLNSFQQLVKLNKKELKKCAFQYRNSINSEKPVKFNFIIKINHEGEVEDIKSPNYTLGSTDLLDCLKSVFISIKYKKLDRKDEVIITQPIILEPTNNT
ncbi:hypothetical protein N9N67_11765 [Bacteriovoracaceae bacterium]|nr:hypothetical protein [Bacteriovoracaceae bacterium]